MSEDQFTKLFTYMQKEFGHVRADIQTVREDVIETKGAVAELGGQIRDYHQEFLMLGRKVDRLERWVHEIAQKADVKLSYE
jgi:uncharacterized coiled-coil DUF342 family protein